MLIEGWPWFDGLYWTLITMSTVAGISGAEIFLGSQAQPLQARALSAVSVFVFGTEELDNLREAAPAIPVLVAHHLAQSLT